MASHQSPTYDYIIVGAGSAGCVLANRLSADGQAQVLLIEAGPSDNRWRLRMPLGFVSLLGTPRFNWNFETAPTPQLGGRRLNCPAGKVLGGGSSINGMLHVRGHRSDFDAWSSSGCRGWSAGEVWPYFNSSESVAGHRGGDRGRDGPLLVEAASHTQPLDEVFLASGAELGFPSTDDFNGTQQEGFGHYDRTVVGGRRESVANAYYKPAKARPNLHLLLGGTVSHIVLVQNVARAVEVTRNAQTERYAASAEVILCAGAIGTPALLQRSGVGNSEHLKRIGIDCLHRLDAVGEGLQNHVEATVQYQGLRPNTVHAQTLGLRRYLSGVRWFLHRGGICATNHWETGAFVRSASAHYPDLQLIFCPISLKPGTLEPTPWPGFQIHVGLQKPTSRGWIRLRSANLSTAPEIQLNFFAEPADRTTLAKAVALSRELVSSVAFREHRGEETQPGKSVRTVRQIEDWLIANAENSYHLTSSCRMGASDDDTCVVDSSCRVRGLAGLRVVDASVMPSVVNANTHATVVMIAEKVAAAMVAG